MPDNIVTVLFAEMDGLIAIFIVFICFIVFIAIVSAIFNSRCPRCKKFFAAKKINDQLVQMGSVYYKTDHSGSRPKQVAYQKNLYRCDYVCKNCDHEWTRNVTRKEKV